MLVVRRIRRGEGTLYRSLRLTSLAESPDAFSTTLESANARSLESWSEQADGAAVGQDRAVFIALCNDQPVGIAALYRDSEEEGLGEVVQVWVDSAHRGGPAAGELLDSLLTWARDSGFERLSAWINDENRRAARFFGKHGFELTSETAPFRPGFDQAARLMTRTV